MRKKLIKTEGQKGITLIVLVITIVVLLILSAVAIGTLSRDNIINRARSASSQYEDASNNEENILSEYERAMHIDESDDEIWKTRGMNITKAIIGKEYEFTGPINNSSENYMTNNIKITLNKDGSFYWGRIYLQDGKEENDYTIISSGDIQAALDAGMASCSGDTFAFPDGFFGTATIKFNENAATLIVNGNEYHSK